MSEEATGENYLTDLDADTVNEEEIEVPSDLLDRWQELVNTLAKIAGTPAGLIMKVDRPYIEVFRTSNTDGNPYEEGDREKLDGLYCEEVIESDERLIIENALESKKWKDNPDIELGMISYLGYPIKWPNEKPFGTICTLDDQERGYDEETMELLEHFRDLVETQLALLYDNRRVNQKSEKLSKTKSVLRETKEKLEKLHEAVDLLQQQDCEEDLLQNAGEVAGKTLDFEKCGILLLEEDELVPRASSAGLDPDETTSFKIDEGIVGKSFQQERTIWGDDVRNYPEAESTEVVCRSFISVPIGEIGILGLFSEEVGKFDEQDVKLAEILAGHLREEIKRVRLEEDLRQQAIRDPLTELYNRRYFNETLQKEAKQAKRYHKPLAFLMIDVNLFKEINDRYSHQRGDEVLREVASLLEENVRDADTVVRYGGDEFLVMMPETNGESKNTVKRLQDKLSQWNEESALLDFPLTLAMGVSHWSPGQERDVEEALSEADEKMYEDKGS
jgi:diguanylate cyclase (GGDEF)-like protein